MQNWIEFYWLSLKNLKARDQSQGYILLGFNVNLDKIIRIAPTNFSNYFSEFQDFKDLTDIILNEKIIEKKKDFFDLFVDAIKEGKAEEYLINKRIQEWIEKNFSFEKICVGGQAAIIANLVSNFGYKNIVLNLPAKDERLKHLLNEEIRVPIKSDNKIKLLPIKDVLFRGKYNIDHYIFEFSSGQYSLGEKCIICSRDNRFIASADTVNSKMIIADEFIEWSKKNAKLIRNVILSGFHLLRKDSTKELQNNNSLKRTIELINQLRKKNEEIKIHIELASFSNFETLNFVVERLFPVVDSIGLNEQELITLTRIYDKDLSSKMQSGTIINYFKGLYEIFKKYPDLRIHFHFLGYYIVLSRPISEEKILIRRSALIKAAIKAFQKITTSQNLLLKKENIQSFISLEGMKEIKMLEKFLVKEYETEKTLSSEGFFKSKKFTIVAIPTLIEKNPTRLVGLGDTISSLSFIED